VITKCSGQTVKILHPYLLDFTEPENSRKTAPQLFQRTFGNCCTRFLGAILPGKPGLAGFIGAKDNGNGGENWCYKTCKAPVKSSSPTNQNQAVDEKKQ